MLVGKLIDNMDVKSYPRYKDQDITPYVLSQVALQQWTSVNSNGETLQQEAARKLSSMKKDYGQGICTLVMIFNASGETLTFQDHQDWSGAWGKYTPDRTIGNGQVMIFLHTKTFMFRGSEGSLIYRGTSGLDFLFAWDTPYWGSNKVYVSDNVNDYWPNNESWDKVKSKLETSASSSFYDSNTNDSFSIFAGIGEQNTSPIANFSIKRKN